MKYGRLADFFFIGLGIVPAVLVYGGLPDLAILMFVPLMLIACLFGVAEQKIENPEHSTSNDADGVDPGQGTVPRDAPGLAFRGRQPRE